MESRIVLFPEDTTPIQVAAPDDACDQWVVTFGDPGSRVQIHTDSPFLCALVDAAFAAMTKADAL